MNFQNVFLPIPSSCEGTPQMKSVHLGPDQWPQTARQWLLHRASLPSFREFASAHLKKEYFISFYLN